MSMDLTKKTYSLETEHFIAGTTVGIVPAVKEAAEDLPKYAPVLLSEGKVKKVADVDGTHPLSTTGLYGLTVEEAKTGEDAIVYLTGEFFADALTLPTGVKAEDLEVPLRNIGIFLK